MNNFDAIIVVLSVAELCINNESNTGISAFRAVRIFRVFRVLRVTKLIR